MDDIKIQPIKDTKLNYTFEIIFKSLNVKLIDVVTNEYMFLRDFFEDSSLLIDIFAKTTQNLTNFFLNYLNTSYDTIGIMIMLRLSRLFDQLMNKKKIYHFNEYFTQLQLSFYQKLKQIIEINIKLIKEVNLTQLIASETNSHNIAKRYGSLASSLNALNKDEQLKKSINELLETLRLSVVKLLQDIPDKFEDKKKYVWLINSYDIIITKFMQYNIECADGFHFRSLIDLIVHNLVVKMINEYFGKLLTFNETNEKLDTQGLSNIQIQSKVDLHLLEELVKNFEKNWRICLKTIYLDLSKWFRNYNTGMYIFNEVVTKIIEQNIKLNQVVQLCYQDPPYRNFLVSTHTIKNELRSYLSTK